MLKVDEEFSRIASLDACAVMGTMRESTFDQLVFTVAQLMRVKGAAFVLVDRDNLWPKSSVGITEQHLGSTEIFMRHVVATSSLLVVENAPSDARFAKDLVAGELEFHFCVAAPLYGPNRQVVGCLCALDRQSRTVSDRQLIAMHQLARQGSELLQLRVRDLDLSLAS